MEWAGAARGAPADSGWRVELDEARAVLRSAELFPCEGGAARGENGAGSMPANFAPAPSLAAPRAAPSALPAPLPLALHADGALVVSVPSLPGQVYCGVELLFARTGKARDRDKHPDEWPGDSLMLRGRAVHESGRVRPVFIRSRLAHGATYRFDAPLVHGGDQQGTVFLRFDPSGLFSDTDFATADEDRLARDVLRNLVRGVSVAATNSPVELPARETVVVRFSAAAQGAALDCEQPPRRGWGLRDLRFFVSEVKLIDAQGREVPMAIATEGAWQGEGVALLDFENGRGICRDGSRGVRTELVGTVPIPPDGLPTFTGIRFSLAVPFAQNHADPAAAVGPLARTSMHWSWRAGYKFIRLSAERAGGGSYRIHLGSSGCEGRIGSIERCAYPSRPEVFLTGIDPLGEPIRFDPAPLFQVLDKMSARERSGGCMGLPDSPACRPILPLLGLDAEGRTVGPSLLFRGATALPGLAVPRGVRQAAQRAGKPSPGGAAGGAGQDAFVSWEIARPDHVPPPLLRSDEIPRPATIALGRHLFYDGRLSADGSMSCATCHQQHRAFTDGHAEMRGVTGEAIVRNAMSLANLVYSPRLTWANPHLERLEHQARIPLFGEEPVEMGMAGREDELLARLRAEPRYADLFRAAWPDDPDPFTLGHVLEALAAFERTLLSFGAPLDRFLAGEPEALSPGARRGFRLFHSERLECFHCHGGALFSDSLTHAGLPTGEIAFHNTGLYDEDGTGAYPAEDTGLHSVTRRADDMGRFRAPTLRNIAVTAPYMHDGSVATLDEVIDHYAQGGRAAAPGNLRKSEFVSGFILGEGERADLLAFLESLTDEDFLANPAFSDPW